MILIISQEEDYSTSEVIQWLLYYNAPLIQWPYVRRITLRQKQILESIYL